MVLTMSEEYLIKFCTDLEITAVKFFFWFEYKDSNLLIPFLL